MTIQIDAATLDLQPSSECAFLPRVRYAQRPIRIGFHPGALPVPPWQGEHSSLLLAELKLALRGLPGDWLHKQCWFCKLNRGQLVVSRRRNQQSTASRRLHRRFHSAGSVSTNDHNRHHVWKLIFYENDTTLVIKPLKPPFTSVLPHGRCIRLMPPVSSLRLLRLPQRYVSARHEANRREARTLSTGRVGTTWITILKLNGLSPAAKQEFPLRLV